MSSQVTRRSVAKGAAWSIPAVTVASSAPATAASGTQTAVANTVCNLFYGTGTASSQYHSIYFQFTSSTGVIPAGSIITNQVCVSPPAGGTWNIPTNTYPAGSSPTSTLGQWYISFTDSAGKALPSGTQMTGQQCFNVVFTFNQSTNTSDLACLNGVIWNDTYLLPPQAAMTVATDTSVAGTSASSGGSGSLAYTAAQRYPTTVNGSGRFPHTFTSKSGLQSCYPSVSSSQQMQSDGADDVACYPTGTTITTARCAWNGRTCISSATGQCTPPYKAAVSGETDIPSMC